MRLLARLLMTLQLATAPVLAADEPQFVFGPGIEDVFAVEEMRLAIATDEATAWARNLAADPRCIVSIEGAAAPYRAEPLADEARRDAIVALILRYGTPAERLGMGPAFRLRPDPRAMGVPG